MTTTTINFSNPLTKNQILERLFKTEQITMDELLTLLQTEKEYVSTPAPSPWYPFGPTYTNCHQNIGL